LKKAVLSFNLLSISFRPLGVFRFGSSLRLTH
jgi:hypothetical protein